MTSNQIKNAVSKSLKILACLKRLSSFLDKKKDFKQLAEIYDNMLIATMPGDFYDMNDGYPVLTSKQSRRRIYMT